MEMNAFITRALDWSWEKVNKAIEGLSQEDLAQRPTDESDSIGWLLWHLARSEDIMVNSSLRQRPQVWVEGDWQKRFGGDPSPREISFGGTPQKATEFRMPSPEVLIGYRNAVRACTKEYLNALQPGDVARQVPAWSGTGTVPASGYLLALLEEDLAHGGQITYLSGMYKSKEWPSKGLSLGQSQAARIRGRKVAEGRGAGLSYQNLGSRRVQQ